MPTQKLSYLLLVVFYICSITATAQAPINYDQLFSEYKYSPEDKFQAYLDTINKYTFVDKRIVDYCLEECAILFEQDIDITADDQLRYVLTLISNEIENRSPLGSFQLINDYQYLLDNEDISRDNRTQFNYLKAYTSFVLNDTKDAQLAYQDMYEDAKANQDTLGTIKALYSMGQIHMDDEEYPKALERLHEVKKLEEQANVGPSIFYLVRLELSTTYLELEKYDEALVLIEEALEALKTSELQEFTPDFLLLKGDILLNKKEYAAAQDVLSAAVSAMDATNSYYMLSASKIFRARLLSAQNLNKPALDIYESLLQDTSITNTSKLDIYELTHALCNKKGNNSKAYKYLMLTKELQEEITKNKKLQQTNYLNIKFQSAEKEKENQLLAAEVLQKQSRNQLLYALVTISIIGLLVLFGAYYQKQNFANKLELEVQNRTQELEQSNGSLNKTNKELDEFNQILSHDLKEPLRSIVGFSRLLRKEVDENSKAEEYSGFIEKSGKQLYQIIEDVSKFQSINSFSQKPSVDIDPQKLITGITKRLQKKYPAKSFKINHASLPILHSNEPVLNLTFENIIENGIVFNQSTTPEIQIRHYQRNGNHVFEFQDNGIGIEPKYHEKVFEMFKRLHNRKAYKGSGLGLSTTKKMLKKLDGDIKIKDLEKDEGSLFEISIPIKG